MKDLIIEAGGTKSNLAIISDSKIEEIVISAGINFTRDDVYEKYAIWKNSIPVNEYKSITIFAAGAEANTLPAINAAADFFTYQSIAIYSDMLAACIACSEGEKSLVAILGTGSNACAYNGHDIELNIAPGGFILGDEGSGAHIGKLFLTDYLRGKLSPHITEKLEKNLGYSTAFVVENIYKKSIVNAVSFMAGCTHFISEYREEPSVQKVLNNSFTGFKNYLQDNYKNYSNDLYTVGSIGSIFYDELKNTLADTGIEYKKNIQYPIHDLCMNWIKRKV